MLTCCPSAWHVTSNAASIAKSHFDPEASPECLRRRRAHKTLAIPHGLIKATLRSLHGQFWLLFGTHMRGFHNSSQLGCSNSQALYSKARILLEGYNGLNPNFDLSMYKHVTIKICNIVIHMISMYVIYIYYIYICNYMHMIMYGLCMHNLVRIVHMMN